MSADARSKNHGAVAGALLVPIGENPAFGTCHREIEPSARR